VIATTDEGTRAALSEARHIARRLNVVRPVLIIPRIGSPPPSLDARAADEAVVDDYRQMAQQAGLDVTLRLCASRTYGEALRWMLPRRSIVVIGGRSRWWWPTREQRIADHLKSAGHETVFADASRPSHTSE
jgi:hypothetical protein